jgi:hypothetical protein
MTHLEDVAERLGELDAKLDGLDKRDRTVKKQLGEFAERILGLEERLKTMERGSEQAAAAPPPASGGAAMAAAASGSPGGSGNAGGQPATFAFSRPRDPRRDEARRRGHELALASGFAPDPGSEPGRFSAPRYPSSAKPGDTVYIENVPWQRVGPVTVEKMSVRFAHSNRTISFSLPQSVGSGDVVRVEINVPNLRPFGFPLTIE